MNKTTIIAVIIVAIFGLGGYFAFHSGDKEAGNANNASSKAISSNTGVKCIQKNNVGGNELETTIYFYKNKMRYDGSLGMAVHGQKDIHIISDGSGNQYMWGQSILGSLGAGKGLKMVADSEQDFGPDIDIEELKKHDFKAPGITCTAWNPDESLFELPKDIEFTDMDNMMAPMMPGVNQQNAGGAGLGDMCAMCDAIPDAQAKQECKKSCEE